MHRQVIGKLSPRLVVEARAPDGTVEAVRVADASAFAFGVQWHPEYWAATDPASGALFRAFADAARERAAQRPAARGGVRRCSSGRSPQHDHRSRPSTTRGSHLDDIELRVRALETLLTEKGYVDPAALDVFIETYETKIGPRNGAKVVAKAWSDPAYREWLLQGRARRRSRELGFTGRQGEHMVALENTPDTHNMVVCTLCSCYPVAVLGLPPVWYKSPPYRSRAVIDPRGVLAEFGVTLPEATKIRVWDSTAEIRYLVVPMRPAGTDGWSEEKLADLVTRDSMIGTGLPLAPGSAA